MSLEPGSARESGVATGFLDTLEARARARPRSVVFPESAEPRVLRAVSACLDRGLVAPVLLGPPDEVVSGLREAGGDPERCRILDPREATRVEGALEHFRRRREGRDDGEDRLAAWSRDPLMQAAHLVASGQADGALAGSVRTTADVVRAGLMGIGLDTDVQTVSSSFYMVFGGDHPSGPSVLTFTDAGVVPEPTADELASIAVAAARARSRIVGDEPRVGFLSYSTLGSAEGTSVTRMRQALAAFRALEPDVPADGELQGDAALSPVVAQRKAPGSAVAGTVNVLVFPDLSAANLAYKLVQHLGGAVALGPILQGLARPFNDLSRGAEPADIAAAACITSLMAE